MCDIRTFVDEGPGHPSGVTDLGDGTVAAVDQTLFASRALEVSR